jgi:glucose-1-phosphate adenylyltransferase
MKKNIIAMLLAGGVGSRLLTLVRERAKPAIPFGGIYRIIDFTMSNIANSTIDVVGILTQYKPLSLMEHIDNGRPWDLSGRTRLVEILPPKTGEDISDWYKGTSDAVYQNINFIEDFSPELVLVVSGDHIYNMNYNDLTMFHKKTRAEVTICLIDVPISKAHHFGIAEISSDGKIIEWTEKPRKPRANLASMGIYLFNKRILTQTLRKITRTNGVDFAKNIIPALLKKRKVYGFKFTGYWRDVGTVDAYWDANMDLLRKIPGFHIEDYKIKTNLSVRGEIGDQPPSYFSKYSKISNSIISRGCVIEGNVENSILSPGIRINRNATVSNSIIFHNTIIGQNASVERCIIDKSVIIGRSTKIGFGKSIPNTKFPSQLFSGITIIGKKAKISPNIRIGKNCIINPRVKVHKNHTSGNFVG